MQAERGLDPVLLRERCGCGHGLGRLEPRVSAFPNHRLMQKVLVSRTTGNRAGYRYTGQPPAFTCPARTSGRPCCITAFIVRACKLLVPPASSKRWRQEVSSQASCSPRGLQHGWAIRGAAPPRSCRLPPPLQPEEGCKGGCGVLCSRDINRSDKYALTSIMLLSCSAKK